jgi:hypothetical protein
MIGIMQKIFAPIKRILPSAVSSPLRATITALVTPFRFSRTTGHWKSSLKCSAIARDGRPIPWYTYPSIDFLAQRKFTDKNILEFGGGQSTLWWSARAKSVLTIEPDADWASRLKLQISQNVTIHHVPEDHEHRDMSLVIAAISKSPIKKFDVIIVDGHLRKEATNLAFQYLAEDGAIIIDNAEGYGFFEEINKHNCQRVDFFGFAPSVSLRHCTSLVFVNSCFMFDARYEIPNLEIYNS